MLLKVKVKSLSCVQLFATPWIVAYQANRTEQLKSNKASDMAAAVFGLCESCPELAPTVHARSCS